MPLPSVLIVDDEAELTTALEERLSLRGFTALGVNNGTAALEQLTAGPWDVVLVDVKMPGLGGLELLQAIRQRYPHQPMVLLTGHASERDAEAAGMLGVTAYLMKPVRIENLMQVLKDVAGQKAGES